MKGKRIFIYVVFALLAIAIIAFVACSLLGMTRMRDSVDLSAGEEGATLRLVFDADSAYSYCAEQCSFGPRTMNSTAHAQCGEWIKNKFASFGLVVESQPVNLKAYDGTMLWADNIIARLNAQSTSRILLCAHWDSRPWADNDPNPDNRHKPVLAANDGASGVAVLLELARMLTTDSASVNIGVDFICFDAEDYGVPQWDEDVYGETNSWALGSRYWAEQYAASNDDGSKYEYGILLDMVGGEGAHFYKEGISMIYAPEVVENVWRAARRAGYGSYFPSAKGIYVTDDHTPVNEIASIPCIDIISYYPDCPQSSFGPTWHTVDDTMEHISTRTLKAVGQTLAVLLAAY